MRTTETPIKTVGIFNFVRVDYYDGTRYQDSDIMVRICDGVNDHIRRGVEGIDTSKWGENGIEGKEIMAIYDPTGKLLTVTLIPPK